MRSGKDKKDRYTLLSNECLCTLREYWSIYCSKHPDELLFMGLKLTNAFHSESHCHGAHQSCGATVTAPPTILRIATSVQDFFRNQIDLYMHDNPLSLAQLKVVQAILSCWTATLGGHVDTCDECGFEKISYNSYRNGNCPKCQTLAKEQWIENQQNNLLNAKYFHVVFTVPDDLNSIFYQNQIQLYGLLFKAVIIHGIVGKILTRRSL